MPSWHSAYLVKYRDSFTLISTKRKMKFGKDSDVAGFFFAVFVAGFNRHNARKAVGGDSAKDDDSGTSI
jgi:hypothetical protein